MKSQTRNLLPFLLLLSPLFLFSQNFIGIKGQINNLSAPLVIKRDLLAKPLGATLNPGFGLFFEFNINENFAFQPEINFQEQRKSFLLTGSDRTINISTIEYIRIPLLLKYSIPFEKWKFVALLGPNPGYGIRLKSGESKNNYEFTDYEMLNFEEHQVSRFDLGILGGIGIEKLIANRFKTTLSLRYNFGIMDITEDDISTFHNRGYILDMGFLIPLYIFNSTKKSSN